MALWNFLDGGPSRSEPLFGIFMSMRDGASGTNPRQQPTGAWQVSRCWVIWILLVYDKFVEYSIHELSTLAQNL
jgi:hypothetical protein